ncbi:MAG: RecX family transcriptional regulator [Anaerolineae bacterium]|nr:RecX family transcriptional regulator [Anaerolineae bacterium]
MPAGIVTALEIQKRNKERVNVYLDGEYAFSLDMMKAAMLHKGQQLTEAEITALRDEDDVIRAFDRAIRFLAYRPRSTEEVRRNLADKAVPETVIEAAIARLNQRGYLDDRAFAAFWIENRSQFKPLSPRALRYELRQKGVAAAVIDELLASVDAEDAAYRAAQARVNRLQGSSRDLFRQKLMRFLQGRGFSYDIMRDVAEQLIEELELENPNYFSDEE